MLGEAALGEAAGSYLPPQGGWYPRLGRGRITYEIAVTVPEGGQALATGRETARETADGRVTTGLDRRSARWRPVP